MRDVRIDVGDLPFARRERLAVAVAKALLDDPMLLSWYDGERGAESPRGVSECGSAPAWQGARDYARNRDGALAVWFDGDRYLFCFRDNAIV